MDDLKKEAQRHFEKLDKSIEYHEKRLNSDLPNGIKRAIQAEVDMLHFVAQYTKEALALHGVDLS